MRSMKRAVQLSSKDINCDAISATTEHGMLCICVFKIKPADQPAPRMIPVRTTCALKQ